MLSRFAVLKRAAAAALFAFCAAAPAGEPVVASSFMVAAANPLAVNAGYAVLERGGSALDAAIAVQLMLGLVEPQSSGLGGGAFILHWSAKERRLQSYDGRETAPAAARPDRFLEPRGKPLAFLDAAIGGRSVGVPGVVRVLELAHREHGVRPWSELFAPALAAAEDGFAMSPRLHGALARERFLRNDPAASALYYGPDGEPKPIGTRIRNAAYAATLRALAAEGPDAFYRGEIAAGMVRAVRQHAQPGDLAEADLAGYRALERDVLCGAYRIWQVCSMGPPSAGGVALLQILGLLERTPFHRAPPHSASALHLFSEAARLAYADRARYLGDADFVAVPLSRLLAAEYLARRARLIGERAMPGAAPGDTEAGTTHLSIVDARGNAVAMTSSIESAFGSRIMVHGFLLNNQLTDFDFRPGSANEVGGGKRPRSSMAPTLVFAPDGSLRLAIGSPGGAMIINYVAKALVGTLDWQLDVQSAIDLPNFGARDPATLIEAGSRYESLRGELAARGHEIEVLPLESGLHGIERAGVRWRGGADARREGTVRGR
jgi:gamma-glutamyltranspeptidase/glutathione hydrolase